MKNHYSRFISSVGLIAMFGLQSLIGCSSLSKKKITEKSITTYFCGYKAYKENESRICNILFREVRYPETVCHAMQRMDTNGDYFLSKDEIKNFKAK